VRMLASAINPSDIVTICGAYSSRVGLPFFPGYEGVGIVEQVGDCVTALQVGTRVLPLGSASCWQEFKTVEAEWCFPVSDDLTLHQAATMYVNPATAWLMLSAHVDIRARPNVLISAAASAVGCMMV
jgi:NADPH:quinone reductase-like Zn-dependent oxidoreductase